MKQLKYKDLLEIYAQKDELEKKFLKQRGWKNDFASSCSLFFWTKRINGTFTMLDKETALIYESNKQYEEHNV